MHFHHFCNHNMSKYFNLGCGHNSQSMCKSDLVSSSTITGVVFELCKIVSYLLVCSAHKQPSALEIENYNVNWLGQHQSGEKYFTSWEPRFLGQYFTQDSVIHGPVGADKKLILAKRGGGYDYWHEHAAFQSVGRLAMTLVATKNDIIFFFFTPSSTFLIEGALGSKNLFRES